MSYRTDEYKAVEGQLETIDSALNVMMIAMRILKNAEDGQIVVSLEALASAISLAHTTISETIDAIRETKLT